MAIKGFAAAEVEEIYTRALELAAQQGDSRQAFMVQWLLGLFHYFRAEMRPAHEVAAHLMVLANDLRESRDRSRSSPRIGGYARRPRQVR